MDIQNQLKNLPKSPGVYKFLDKEGKILYIGKATSLKNRAGSYFSRPLDDRLQAMVGQISKIEYEKTDSVIEALIAEANLIKKHQPKYNIKEKDDKSFINIVITREKWPKIFIERKKNLESMADKVHKVEKSKLYKIYGPYTSAKSARLALEIIRKIFTFCANPGEDKECFYHQIGQCPGACAGEISAQDYRGIIKNIELFLQGKKPRAIKKLEKEMSEFAKKREFEKAGRVRNRIFALKHIQDIALVGEAAGANDRPLLQMPHRIEAYDISNIGGVLAAGSMAVFIDGEMDKNEYRKFKIKTVESANDVAMLKEILIRRFRRDDWGTPDLILIDGGKGQLNAARAVLQDLGIQNVEVMSIAKGPARKGQKLFKASGAPNIPIKLIENLRDEAHRFAIQYHRFLRSKNMLQ